MRVRDSARIAEQGLKQEHCFAATVAVRFKKNEEKVYTNYIEKTIALHREEEKWLF